MILKFRCNKVGETLTRRLLHLSQQRQLNLQEYQSKALLDANDCTVQRFFVGDSRVDFREKFTENAFDEYVVKAQILAGGRGKGRFADGPAGLGGIFISREPEKAHHSALEMLNKRLVTKQTRADGALVKRVMIAESVPIKRETYLAILLDRESNGPIVMASPAGGMDIEEVAAQTPHLILKESISIETGISDEQSRKIADFLKFPASLREAAATQIRRLYHLFIKVDATQIEINPFAETSDGRVFCIDAKLAFDDSAAFRQREIFSLEDEEEHDPRELEAKKNHLNYIGLDGNIACLVNGAGLAMATMDIIKLQGGLPANFLDVGGSVTEEQVQKAFHILSADPNVKAILVNIFGGIVNCATIANGLLRAFEKVHLKVPLVVRLEGTNVEEARRFLNASRLPILTARNLDEAAKKAVEAAKNFATTAAVHQQPPPQQQPLRAQAASCTNPPPMETKEPLKKACGGIS